jgi:nucleolar protein 56
MVVVNYLLFESAVGFSVFEVVHQADTVGLELPEVKDAMKTLDKFGKMIQLRSFNPWTYVSHEVPWSPHRRAMAEACVHSESTTD